VFGITIEDIRVWPVLFLVSNTVLWYPLKKFTTLSIFSSPSETNEGIAPFPWEIISTISLLVSECWTLTNAGTLPNIDDPCISEPWQL